MTHAMPSPTPIRLLLVDDHFVVRSGIAASLELEDDIRVVAEADDAAEALKAYDQHLPDAVIMDLQLAGSSGIEATVALRQKHPGARILIFSSFARDEDIYRALSGGALGYLQKAAPREELLRAVRDVAAGSRWLPPDIARRLADRLNRPEPSPREREVLVMISQGRSNKEIANELGLSEDTIKRHVSSVMDKLGANDRAQAVTEALRRGLIEL